MSQSVNSLFQAAHEEGMLSKQALQTLTVVDLGAQIQAALGTPAIDMQTSEVVLVTVMPDDSGSIRFAGNTHAVRDGHNGVIDALMGSKQKDSILMHTRYLNGLILFPYWPLQQAVRMDSSNYNPNLGTPLYDQIAVVLGTVIAKAQEFSDNGIPVRAVTLVVTDGRDEHSIKQTPQTLRPLIQDLLMTEQHIIAAMGIDDGGQTDFKEIFREMGIHDEWILTPGNSPSEVRKAFGTFSQSAVRASQGAASFSKTAIGGFGQ